MKIETVTTSNFEMVLPLIAEYQRFYNAEPNESRNRAHFSQFLEDHAQGILFLALDNDGASLGFATIYFPFSSVRAQPDCVMNDLLTLPDARGKGVGRALIAHCREYARASGYHSLLWMTDQSNACAQRLYDKTGAQSSTRLEYVLSTELAD